MSLTYEIIDNLFDCVDIIGLLRIAYTANILLVIGIAFDQMYASRDCDVSTKLSPGSLEIFSGFLSPTTANLPRVTNTEARMTQGNA